MHKVNLSSLGYIIGLIFCSTLIAEERPDTGKTENDYPTSARVDYVIGCMASNGQTHEMLQKCSCSIDHIAKSISYTEYVQISTLVSMQQMESVGRNTVFKDSTWSKKAIARLRDVQADSTLRCF